MTITDTDKGYAQIARSLRSMSDMTLRVGVFDGAYPEGQSVAEVALYLEFGTSDIEEQAFMRDAYESNRQKYDRMLIDGYDSISRGRMTMRQLLTRIGEQAVEDIRQAIQKRDLVDTRRLLNAVAFEVV